MARRLAPTASHEGPAPEPAKPQEEAIAQRVAADPNRPARRDSVISVRTLVTAALIVLGVVALVAFLASIIDIVLVVLVAIVFAEGIRPLVADLHRRRVPTPVGILAVYVAILAFIAVMVLLLVQPIVSEAQSLASHFPTYQRELLNWFSGVEKQLHFNVDITKQVSSLLGATQQILFAIGGTIFSIIVDFVLVLVVGFLWLVSSDRLKAFAVDLFPEAHHALVVDIFREMGFRMGGFLRASAINSLAVGVVVGVACAVLRLPDPVILGIFAGLAAAIPMVGGIVGVIPAVLLGFTVSPEYPIVVLAVLLVIQLIDANTVIPMVMNRVVSLPALGVVLALLVGGALQGLIGALLAVPVAAVLQVLLVRVMVPAIHHAQGRTDQAYAKAYVPLSPDLKDSAPRMGGRRVNPR
ncbi:MAG TPA: AI-2E family transporter [Candidatus Dormibacteraeota bacterium]